MKQDNENNRNSEVLSTLKEIKKNLAQNTEKLEDLEEDISYFIDILKRYIAQVEKSKNIDTIIVNILFFSLGLLLGFALTLLFFKL